MASPVKKTDSDTKSEAPNSTHIDACPLELKEIERDQSILSVIQRQVALVVRIPMDVAGIVATYTFQNAYQRMVRKLVRKRGLTHEAKHLLMMQYPRGVVRVGEGAKYDDANGEPVPLWDMYVVYMDQNNQRMIQFWCWEDWPDSRRDKGYELWSSKDYPKPLEVFWADGNDWRYRHLRWFGMVPPELGKQRSIMYGMSMSVSVHWDPDEPDSEDELRHYGYDCTTHQDQFDTRMVVYEQRKADREAVVEELM